MDITVVGRNAEISSRLRDYVEEKATKVEQYDPRVQRVEVEVTHERNPRQADTAERVEITVISKDHYEIEERRVGKECRSRWSPYH